jgi:hypothetical protein
VLAFDTVPGAMPAAVDGFTIHPVDVDPGGAVAWVTAL